MRVVSLSSVSSASLLLAVLLPSAARLAGRGRRLVSGSPGNPFVNVAPLPPQQVQNPSVCCDKLEPRPVCFFEKCCDDGSWTCLSGGKYMCGGSETSNPSGKVCGEDEEVVVINQPSCIVETKTCPDGTTTVVRDPDNGCEYFPCPSNEDLPETTPELTDESTAEAQPTTEEPSKPCCNISGKLGCEDAMCCNDGTWSCQFNGVYTCSGERTMNLSGVECKVDVAPGEPLPTKTTIDPVTAESMAGTTTGGEEPPIADNEESQGCTKELRRCRHGPSVGRDANNNCEFLPCLTKAAAKQLRGKRKGLKKRIQNKVKRAKIIAKRKRKRAVRKYRKHVRAQRLQLNQEAIGNVKTTTKASRTRKSRKDDRL